MTRTEWIQRSAPVLTGVAGLADWPIEEDDLDGLFAEWIVVDGLPLYGRPWRYANDGETLTVAYETASGTRQTREWTFVEADSYLVDAEEGPDPRDFEANVAAVWDWLAAVDPGALPRTQKEESHRPAPKPVERGRQDEEPPVPPDDWWLREAGSVAVTQASPERWHGFRVIRGGETAVFA